MLVLVKRRAVVTDVDILEDLKNVIPAANGQLVTVHGQFALGDCGKRIFQWSENSVLITLVGLVEESNVSATGRWICIPQGDCIEVEWTAAASDTDHTNWIQRAIDACEFRVLGARTPLIAQLTSRTYSVSDTIQLGNPMNNGFHSIGLRGVGAESASSIISFTRRDRPVLAINRGRGCEIFKVNFQSSSVYNGYPNDATAKIDIWNFWRNREAILDNLYESTDHHSYGLYRFYGGIVQDPYAAQITIGNGGMGPGGSVIDTNDAGQYLPDPNLATEYSSNAAIASGYVAGNPLTYYNVAGGSSRSSVEKCAFGRFPCAVCISGSPDGNNGDYFKLFSSTVFGCDTVMAGGHQNSRLVEIKGCTGTQCGVVLSFGGYGFSTSFGGTVEINNCEFGRGLMLARDQGAYALYGINEPGRCNSPSQLSVHEYYSEGSIKIIEAFSVNNEDQLIISNSYFHLEQLKENYSGLLWSHIHWSSGQVILSKSEFRLNQVVVSNSLLNISANKLDIASCTVQYTTAAGFAEAWRNWALACGGVRVRWGVNTNFFAPAAQFNGNLSVIVSGGEETFRGNNSITSKMLVPRKEIGGAFKGDTDSNYFGVIESTLGYEITPTLGAWDGVNKIFTLSTVRADLFAILSDPDRQIANQFANNMLFVLVSFSVLNPTYQGGGPAGFTVAYDRVLGDNWLAQVTSLTIGVDAASSSMAITIMGATSDDGVNEIDFSAAAFSRFTMLTSGEGVV